MKKISLNENWSLCQIGGGETKGCIFQIEKIPCQVHDVLIKEKIIENPNIHGINHDRWIGRSDWKYEKEFYLENLEGTWNLIMEGLDTFAWVYINDELVVRNESVYMPCKIYRLQGLRQGVNRISLIFRSPFQELEKIELPENYAKYVPDFCKARVFRSGYYGFSGPLPDLVRMGIYGEIWLEQVEENGFKTVSANVSLNESLDQGEIHLEISYCNEPEEQECLYYSVTDSRGNVVASGEAPAEKKAEIKIEAPDLWWPRSHGRQETYEVCLKLLYEDRVIDMQRKKIGFRRIEKKGDFDFYINGKPLKLWGVNLTQADSVSGCYHREKIRELLYMAELANCNCIRIWGESEILPEEFYEECDDRGFLLWQDFYLGYNMYNVEEDMMELYRKEATWLVNRLKHHPSLLLWCGGNEVLLARDYQYPGVYCYGEKIFKELYPSICRELDPDRYYHMNCPSGGAYANDPSQGDSHGYTHQWFVPNVKYPVFLSENARFSPPALRTMKHMLSEEELWPEGYEGKVTRENPLPWPETWEEHSCGEKGQRWGPVEHYYDPEKPEELIYNLGAAYGEYVKQDVERVRRGKPDYMPEAPRKTKGHILWKLNNCSNLISYGLVDYFNEPQMVYYFLKRAYEPLQISFSLENHIGVWIVNDTPQQVRGTAKISVFSLEKNCFVKEKHLSFIADPDEAKFLEHLDEFGQIKKDCILTAQVFDIQGTELTRNHEFLDIERHLNFPEDSGVSVEQKGNELIFHTSHFARSIEIIGDNEGDSFGWLFEDNYFDLFPGREKKVKILGRHKKGKILVKGQYDKKYRELLLDKFV